MSKLEDKLKASLKPAKGKANPGKAATRVPTKPVAARPPADKAPAPVRREAVKRPADLNNPASALHPDRIWPD